MPSSTFFLYTTSHDIAASRRFYSELVGLDQLWDEVDQIAYRIDGGVQFAISYDPRVITDDAWSSQPGWAPVLDLEAGPRGVRASWSVPLPPERFQHAVARLQHAGVDMLRSEPFWAGYWSFVVRDPMGQTVELADPITEGPSSP